MVHYSDEPRIEFHLNDFRDRSAILRSLRGLHYRGGNTKTGTHVLMAVIRKSQFLTQMAKVSPSLAPPAGRGISYVLKELFQESLGMRQDVAHVLVLITDGRAQDDVELPSRVARALGQCPFPGAYL